MLLGRNGNDKEKDLRTKKVPVSKRIVYLVSIAIKNKDVCQQIKTTYFVYFKRS